MTENLWDDPQSDPLEDIERCIETIRKSTYCCDPIPMSPQELARYKRMVERWAADNPAQEGF